MTSNEDVFRNLAKALERRDVDALMEFFAEDAVLVDYTNPAVVHQGRPAIAAFVSEVYSTFDDIAVEIVSLLAKEDRLATETIIRATPAGRTDKLEMYYAAFYGFRDGKIISEHAYVDSAQAVPAA
jgi:ketosteroid isomerase-like protein